MPCLRKTKYVATKNSVDSEPQVSQAQLVTADTASRLTPEHCTVARARARLSLEELAEAAGVHLNTVARFENGESVRPRTKEKIAEGIARSAGIDCLATVMGIGQ